jgi:O-antigen/teichoic acid export membrane protein
MTANPASPSPTEEATLAAASRRGAPLVIAGHLASQVIGVGTLAVLCHLLDPADYGLLGAVLPAVMLPRMAVTLGPGIAVIQRRELSNSQLSALFWLQALLGVLAVLVTSGICWQLSIGYDQPSLLPLGIALAGGTLFAALGNQHQALLERDLLFGTASGLRLVAQFIACASAIGYALWRADVWALAIQHVVELIILCAGSWILAGWRPTWPQRPWNIGSVLQFSTFYSLSSLIQFVTQNMEKILFPALFGAAGNRALGLYSQQAYGLMIKPVYLITNPLAGVVISSLAKTSGGSEAHTRLTIAFFRLCALGLFPAAVGLSLVSEDFVLLLGGEKWRDAGLLLKLLAPSIAGIGLTNLAILVLAAHGSGRALLVASGCLLILTLQAAAIGMYFGSRWQPAADEPAYGAAAGFALAFTVLQVFAWCPPFLWFAFRSAGMAPQRLFVALVPAAVAAVLMGLAVGILQWLLPREQLSSPAWRLVIFVGAGVTIYSLVALREIASLRASWQPK